MWSMGYLLIVTNPPSTRKGEKNEGLGDFAWYKNPLSKASNIN